MKRVLKNINYVCDDAELDEYCRQINSDKLYHDFGNKNYEKTVFDLYLPEEKKYDKRKLVVFVHGGGRLFLIFIFFMHLSFFFFFFFKSLSFLFNMSIQDGELDIQIHGDTLYPTTILIYLPASFFS